MNKHNFLIFLCLIFFIQTCYAHPKLNSIDAVPESPPCSNPFHFPFYAGITAGYGSTIWEGLVPNKEKQNVAISMSTPIYVTEGGALWGLFAGYEIIPCFALEAAYLRLPNAKVTFDSRSLFTFMHDGITGLSTHTEMASLMAKVMLLIPCTTIRAYSSIGAAIVHRYDAVTDRNHVNPTFGFGLNYNFTERVMGELGANYTSGYGESELDPAKDYIPFLYAAFLRLAYRF